LRILRVLLLILLLIIVIVIVGGFLIYNDTVRAPLPQTNGALTVSGLDAQVEILRDDWGVPHVYASTPHDLYFAQGYTQAQDRWWQMEFFRYAGSGRIEELTGKNEDVFGTDVFIRTVGWRRASEADFSTMSDDMRAPLQAFADGVNAYISSRPADDLAMQYRVLGITGINIAVQPWTPVDTLVWGKVMAWNLTNSTPRKLTRQALYTTIGEDMTRDFTPPYPYDGDRPTILYPQDLPLSDASAATTAQSSAYVPGAPVSSVLAGGVRADEMMFSGGMGVGSNNWVATGSMTADGTPLLANDPHLGIQMPSLWYEIGLHCLPVTDTCSLDVVGFALAPSPGVIIGHNAEIAWGVTNTEADVQDLYLITLNPDNPLQYQWNGEWRDMTVIPETISFGGGEPSITFNVRVTHLGPILNDNQIDEETGELLGYNNVDPMVLRWTGSDPTTLFRSVLNLNTASNWDEFRAALTDWDLPSQNFVYADVRGNIGYQMPGRIPIRPAGIDGLTPYPADSDDDIWQGYIPFDNLPRIFNPPREYIVTANQAIAPTKYYDQLAETLGADANYLFSYDWAYGERAFRITDMLRERVPNTVETYQQIQGDNLNLSAELIQPYLAALSLDGTAAQARDFLANWDFQMNIESAQAALFGAFNARLLHNLFDDQLPEDIQADNHELYSAVLLMDQPENVWWDDAATPDTIETRDDILQRSLAEAWETVTEMLGSDTSAWQWGKLHTATFVSNPLGMSGVALLEQLVNRGPVPTGGTSDSVNATGWSPASGHFEVNWLPSMRMIVDVGDFDNSLSMHTTGQSGHPSSAHYDDMIDSWRTIQYHPMLYSRDKVEAAATDRLILSPPN
jgi:penicillin amidase